MLKVIQLDIRISSTAVDLEDTQDGRGWYYLAATRCQLLTTLLQ